MTRKQKPVVQHHHFLLRMETEQCPSAADKEMAEHMIYMIIRDIKMKLLDVPKVYYVNHPGYNEGLTAIAPIQTSHIAFHFWKNPERKVLHSPQSRCLLEFDIYTCGTLTVQQLHRVLHHMTSFKPTHIDATLLNRKWSLTIEKHMRWDISEGPWTAWLNSDQFRS